MPQNRHRPQDHPLQQSQGKSRHGAVHGTQGRAEKEDERGQGYPYERAVGGAQTQTQTQAQDDTAAVLSGLVRRLGLPAGLGECGVTLEDLDAVARLSQSNSNVRNNPRPVSEDDARGILAAAY